MTRSARVRLGVLALGALACAGCPGGGEGAREGARAVQMDTSNKQWEDGLSSEQVEAQARAMTPEEAALAGIAVDSSIHVENLGSQDSTPPGAARDTSPPRDTAARRDTTPPRDTVPRRRP
ncbi:MAG TPA: hypothetical protein VFX98_18020 [Longimicrobiaceae bacterium]|nr:hypothetical protein [Longimicrobiaceae bacterium]